MQHDSINSNVSIYFWVSYKIVLVQNAAGQFESACDTHIIIYGIQLVIDVWTDPQHVIGFVHVCRCKEYKSPAQSNVTKCSMKDTGGIFDTEAD